MIRFPRIIFNDGSYRIVEAAAAELVVEERKKDAMGEEHWAFHHRMDFDRSTVTRSALKRLGDLESQRSKVLDRAREIVAARAMISGDKLYHVEKVAEEIIDILTGDLG
jgi:hypothetical protein